MRGSLVACGGTGDPKAPLPAPRSAHPHRGGGEGAPRGAPGDPEVVVAVAPVDRSVTHGRARVRAALAAVLPEDIAVARVEREHVARHGADVDDAVRYCRRGEREAVARVGRGA